MTKDDSWGKTEAQEGSSGLGHKEAVGLGVATWIVSFIWVWVEIKPSEDSRFWSMFPIAMAPFWVPFFDPHPYKVLASRAKCKSSW